MSIRSLPSLFLKTQQRSLLLVSTHFRSISSFLLHQLGFYKLFWKASPCPSSPPIRISQNNFVHSNHQVSPVTTYISYVGTPKSIHYDPPSSSLQVCYIEHYYPFFFFSKPFSWFYHLFYIPNLVLEKDLCFVTVKALSLSLSLSLKL